MLVKGVLVNQVQTSKSCGLHFPCQVRNLFLCVAATAFQETDKSNRISHCCRRRHHHQSSDCQSNASATLTTAPTITATTSNTYRNRSRLLSLLFHSGSALLHQQQYTRLSSKDQRHYSRFSANTILTGTEMMKLTDYDCIGFDLDNTLLRYLILLNICYYLRIN